MSWGDWLFLSSAIGVGVLVAVLLGGTLLVGILTGALRELNRQEAEEAHDRGVNAALDLRSGLER